MLSEAAVPSISIPDLETLATSIHDDTAFVVLTEEVLRGRDIGRISTLLANQPSWSDLPFIILTSRGGPDRHSSARLSESLGNVTFLERPFHPTTFISVARSAMKGRRRQFEARTRLEEISRLNETLEERVAIRTAELQRANRVLSEQIAQREDAEERLRQSQKLEAIGQLTGGVAHDFNNLLMAVLGNLGLLSKYVSHDPNAARLLEGATRGAQRGAALTQRLLAFGRRQDLTVRPTDMVGLIIGMDDLLIRSIGQNIELEKHLPRQLPRALIDANQVELALLNLAINARDAMPSGGKLVLSVRQERLSATRGELCAREYLVLSVSDTGHGMDAATLKRAIDPFFSTKGPGKGTGLGLSMIHGVAVQMNGALELTSVLNEGTTAELWFPATSEATLDEPVKPPVASSETAKLLRVLLVDDDALIAMSSVDMLVDLGHTVTEANSGKAALALLEAGNEFDLMITDYSMPGMNGAELARAALLLAPKMQILVASGYAELPSGAGIDLPKLGKPYSQSQLADEISKLFAGEE